MEEKELEPEQIGLGDELPLSSLKIGMSGDIVRIEGEGRIKRRIFDMGLTPGAEVFLRKKAPLGDPLEVTLRGYELTLRKDEAIHVIVKVTDLSVEEKEAK